MVDEKFLLILSDVVWRFHTYSQYGKKPEKAIKALTKRASGYSSEFYREQFQLNLQLLIATVEAVQGASKHPQPGQEFSAASDVDMEYVMTKLRLSFPGQPDEYLKSHVGMVIYWYYLR